MAEPSGLIWVCVDCMLTHHGYTEHELGATPDREPWALWAGEPYEITAGGACNPDNGCAEGCIEECEVVTFSWSACDGCGSTLGGERHAFTYWTEERV